jgi:WD40 repeat protein
VEVKITHSKSETCARTDVSALSLDILTQCGVLKDRTLKVWSIESGQCLATLQAHTRGVRCVKVLDNGQIVSGSYYGTTRIWN